VKQDIKVGSKVWIVEAGDDFARGEEVRGPFEVRLVGKWHYVVMDGFELEAKNKDENIFLLKRDATHYLKRHRAQAGDLVSFVTEDRLISGLVLKTNTLGSRAIVLIADEDMHEVEDDYTYEPWFTKKGAGKYAIDQERLVVVSRSEKKVS